MLLNKRFDIGSDVCPRAVIVTRGQRYLSLAVTYCEIINIGWTFNFVYFVERAIHKI